MMMMLCGHVIAFCSDKAARVLFRLHSLPDGRIFLSVDSLDSFKNWGHFEPQPKLFMLFVGIRFKSFFGVCADQR